MSKTIQELHLSCVDQQYHIRSYGRVLTFFQFDDLGLKGKAFRALQHGFAKTLHHFPYLTGTLELSQSSPDHLRVVWSESANSEIEIDVSRLLSADFTIAQGPEYEYSNLEATRFAPSAFPAEAFCPRLLRNHPGLDEGDNYAAGRTTFKKGIPLPIMAAQATFIPGGLVLSLWLHHSVLDGTGWSRILEVWSSYTSQYSSGATSSFEKAETLKSPLPSKSLPTNPSAPRLALDDVVKDFAALNGARTSTTRSSAQHLREGPYTVLTKLLHIDATLVSNFRLSLSSQTDTHITVFVTLAALLGAYITEARSNLLVSRGLTKATFSIVINARKHMGPSYANADFLGNLMLSASVTYEPSPSTQQQLQERRIDVLAPLARAIAHAIKSVDTSWILNRLASISCSSHLLTENSDFLFANGPDLYITSWQHMGADYEWHIPGTSTAKPSAMRRAAWTSEGGVIILPRQKGSLEPYAVLVSLAEEDMMILEETMSRDGLLGGT